MIGRLQYSSEDALLGAVSTGIVMLVLSRADFPYLVERTKGYSHTNEQNQPYSQTHSVIGLILHGS